MKILSAIVSMLTVETALSAVASEVVFQKQLDARQTAWLVIERDGTKTNIGPTVCEWPKYSLFVGEKLEGTSPKWVARSFAFSTNAAEPFRFSLLDATMGSNRLSICYKINRATFVEDIRGDSVDPSAHANKNALSRDFSGTGQIVTRAEFSHSGDSNLLRLCFKNLTAQAWALSEQRWVRETSHDIAVPLWAKPVNLSTRQLADDTNRAEVSSNSFNELLWGKAEEGFQVGIEFSKESYRIGDPIVATIHIRNSTNHALTYQFSTISGKERPVDIAIIDRHGQAVVSTNGEFAALVPNESRILKVGSQTLQAQRLDKQFSLKEDTYTVVARLKVPEASRLRSQYVESGPVELHVNGAR